MQDYMKKNAQRGGQPNNASPLQAKTNGIPNSALQDVFAGKRHADSSMMGHSQNLAPSIAAKMSRAFGMDLTGMQVYQSDAMKGTGMRGMAQGNKVVLSSDVNLNTTAGQAVLGHEISHIHAQSQGIGMGHSGLYENAALEHQADTEGLLAAQGRSIYSDGMDTGIGMQYGLGMQGVEGLTPLSGGMSASAGAPMQAWKLSDWFKGGKKKEAPQNEGDIKNLVKNKSDATINAIRGMVDKMKQGVVDREEYYQLVLQKYTDLYKEVLDMMPQDEIKNAGKDEETAEQYIQNWTTQLINEATGGDVFKGEGTLGEYMAIAEHQANIGKSRRMSQESQLYRNIKKDEKRMENSPSLKELQEKSVVMPKKSPLESFLSLFKKKKELKNSEVFKDTIKESKKDFHNTDSDSESNDEESNDEE